MGCTLGAIPTRHCDIDLLGRMTMVGISHPRCHEAGTYPDIVPYLESLRVDDCRVGMPVQKRLAPRLGACPYLPMELRLDDGEGVGQDAKSTLPRARVPQCHRQMAADGQPSRTRFSGLARRRL
jgi:hypothetical protein